MGPGHPIGEVGPFSAFHFLPIEKELNGFGGSMLLGRNSKRRNTQMKSFTNEARKEKEMKKIGRKLHRMDRVSKMASLEDLVIQYALSGDRGFQYWIRIVDNGRDTCSRVVRPERTRVDSACCGFGSECNLQLEAQQSSK